MFSALSRLQKSFGYLTSAVLVVGLAISITQIVQLYSKHLIFTASPSLTSTFGNFNVTNVSDKYTSSFGSADGNKKQNFRGTFDLSSDLSELFNWNTKQVFVYLVAEYPGKRPDVTNKVVLWDKIVKSPSAAKINVKKGRTAYTMFDVAPKFKGQHANVYLEYNIQPKIGFQIWGRSSMNETITLPS